MTRQAIFISHANPEDNSFTLWLGARLSAAGYEVWADLLKLRGGHDWQRRLEEALRQRAYKVLMVGTPQGVDKQGVRNEIQIAHDVGRSIKDPEFIIPLRLAAFDAPFLIAHAQYIDFTHGWASALAELLETLETTYHVPRTRDRLAETVDHWRGVQLRHARTLTNNEDRLISNWLRIAELPETLAFYDFRAGISLEAAQVKMRTSRLPLVPYHRGFLSFAGPEELQQHFAEELPLLCEADVATATFLEEGWPAKRIERWDASRQFSDLARQGLEAFFAEHGLEAYQMSNRQKAWWGTIKTLPIRQLPFQWADGLRGRRQLTGHSEKRRLYWHYGVTPWVQTFPYPHVKLVGRVIFSDNGQTPGGDPRRMHRLRRSFTKSWRNAKWRDMLLAFVYWLAEGKETLAVPLGANAVLTLAVPPESVVAPFSVSFDGDQVEEVDTLDDLDIEDFEAVDVDGDEEWVEDREDLPPAESNDERE
jgi:hypothetical protein